MLRGSVLITALVFSAPVLWQALVDGTVSVDAALIRFLVAMPVAAILVGLFRASFASGDAEERKRRASGD